MLILSNSIAQVINPGQAFTFDTIILKTGCAECFRPNSGAVRLKFKEAMYEVEFGANIGSTEVGTAQIAIFYDGGPLLETTAISQTAAVGDLNNVSRETAVKTDCCNPGSLTIVNTGETPINVGANPSFRVKRIA